MCFNYNEEVIDGFLVTAKTKRVMAVEIDIANRLLEVCKKHNLKIWATGGTLLGAVRHKGFIPWDDDMDFCMKRDDFNKLISIGPSEFQEPYFFQSVYTDSFWGGMIKIRRSDTTMIMNADLLMDYNMGIFIDVFVLDAIPNNPKGFVSIYNRIKFYRKLLINNNIAHPEYLSFFGKFKHSLVSFIFRFTTPGTLHDKVVRLLSANTIDDNEECAMIDFSACQGRNASNIIFCSNKHCYDETIELSFSGINLPCPIGYDEILRRQYGDYMIPKIGGQFHHNTLIEYDKSYKEVLEEIRNH